MQTASSLAASLLALAAAPRTAVLLALLLAAAVVDWLRYRIPNELSLGGMLLGLAFSTVDAPSHGGGLLSGVGGMLIALVSLLPMYALRVFGAGDVKLMAAVGAFVGHADILPVLLAVMVTAGFGSILWMLVQGSTGKVFANLLLIVRAAAAGLLTRGAPGAPSPRINATGRLPYAVCIFAGTIVFLVGDKAGAW